MEKKIDQVKAEKIFNKWMTKVDVDLILSWLENVKDEEKFKFELGCCLYNEILRKTNVEQICRELETKANLINDDAQVVLTMFTCLMKTAIDERNRKTAWLKEKRKTVDSLVDKHGKAMKLILSDCEKILKCAFVGENLSNH